MLALGAEQRRRPGDAASRSATPARCFSVSGSNSAESLGEEPPSGARSPRFRIEVLPRASPGAQPVSERSLSEAVLGTVNWPDQRRRWEGLKVRLASFEPGREGATT